MTERTIPIADLRYHAKAPPIPADPSSYAAATVADRRGRLLHDLRISITDRCNFRCTYCMDEEMTWLPRSEVLTFEELERIARLMVARYGVQSIRLTGGEPTVRAHLEGLVSRLAALETAAGPIDVAMTTNGATMRLLAERLRSHPAVSRVRYPGLPDDPWHQRATAQMSGFGAMLSFEVRGGAEAAETVARSVRIITHATSLGGVESTIERRAKYANSEHVPAGLLRFSVGVEHVEDLWADLDGALRSVSG